MKSSETNDGRSLYTHLGLIVITVVASVMFLLITLYYFDTKEKLQEHLKTDSNIILSRVQNSISYLVESYMVNEYDKLIVNEMKKEDIFAMVVYNEHMAKMLGRDSFYSGKVRNGEWKLEDYDPIKHDAYIKQNTLYEFQMLLYDTNGAKIGKVKLYMSGKLIEKELNELISQSIVNTTMVSLFLMLFLFLSIRKYILRPLYKMISVIDNSDKDGIPLEKIKVSGAAEIRTLSETINHMVETVRDSKNKLNEINSFLHNLIDTAPVRIFWKDTQGKYLGANKLFLKDAGLQTEKEIIGKTDFDLPWAKTQAQNYVNDDNEVLTQKEAKLGITETLTDQQGRTMYLNTSKAPLLDNNNNNFGLLGIYEDITQRVESQEKIKAQEAQIVQQNRLAQMGEMISMIAHQWRQPLSVIGSLVSILQLKTETENFDKELFRSKLKKVVEQTQYLSETIEDFRGFFKPDKIKKEITARQLIEETIKIIAPVLKNHDITLNTEYLCDKELFVFSNELKQVLLNILKNSKDAFEQNNTPNPYIHIEVECIEGSRCSISIEDNAGGIDQDIIDKIFDPYFSTKSEKNGTGLGLYMSRIIVQDHCKGELKVQSSEDKTAFTVII
jgi:PAS domain S-box-containing protein